MLLNRVFRLGRSFRVFRFGGSLQVFRLCGSVTLSQGSALLHVFVEGQTLHPSITAPNAVGRTVGTQPDTAIWLLRLSSHACHDGRIGMLVPRAAHKSLAPIASGLGLFGRVLTEDGIAGHAAVVVPSRMPLAGWEGGRR